MTRSWEKRGRDGTYTIRFDSNQRLQFEASGPATRSADRRGTTGSIWVEEFPENDRWQEWVREHLGESTLAEIQDAVTSELETLYATRKQTFADASEKLAADEPELRREGIDRMRSLAGRYDDLVEPALEQFLVELDEADADTRRRVAEGIRHLAESDPDGVDAVRDKLQPALNDDHPNVRLDIARTLVLITDDDRPSEQLDQIVESLVGLLHEHKRWFSQGPVAGLLGDLGRKNPSAVKPAIEPLARFIQGELRGGSGTSGIGRSSAVQALVEIGSRNLDLIDDYVEVFFEKLDAPRPGVRGYCAEALGIVGSRRPESAERAADALADCLDDTGFVRDQALDALRSIHAAAPDAVKEVLGDDVAVLETDDDAPF